MNELMQKIYFIYFKTGFKVGDMFISFGGMRWEEYKNTEDALKIADYLKKQREELCLT
jgi:hypothetical protein